jgi:superfamily II DNA or RNA helicase
MSQPTQPLAALRRRATKSRHLHTACPEFKFVLRVRQRHVQLYTANAHGTPVSVDHHVCTGPQRMLLRAINEQQELDGLPVRFRDSAAYSDGVVISGRTDLIEMLFECPNVVDAQQWPLQVSARAESALRLQVEPLADPGMWDTHLMIVNPGAAPAVLELPIMLADRYLLAGSTIHRIVPIGSHWSLLPAFVQRVAEHQLSELLTLFVSSFPAIDPVIADWQLDHGRPIIAQPALLLEDVDHSKGLRLTITESVGQFPVDFVRDYDVATVAQLDFDRRRAQLRPVDYCRSLTARQHLRAALDRLSRDHCTASGPSYKFTDDRYWLSEPLAHGFLNSELPVLATEFRLFGAERLIKRRIVLSQPQLTFRLNHNIDYLEGDAMVEIEGQQFDLLDALATYRKSRYIPLSDGRLAVFDPKLMARLERIVSKSKSGIRVSFFDLPLLEELLGTDSTIACAPLARSIFEGFNTLAERRVTLDNFAGTLRPYQLAGLKWLDYLWEHQLGGCLADDMGLGKTVQAIALISRLPRTQSQPVLVVMPRSLLFNWKRELETFVPQVTVHTYHGVGRDWRSAAMADVILTTYGTLRSEIGTMAQQPFSIVILDESQAIKNHETRVSNAVCKLNARFRLALSGTPIENHLGELYALFRFLNPSMFGSLADFQRNYVRPIQVGFNAEVADDLRKRIFPFIMRRLKADVLKDLPPKMEQVLFVEMTPVQRDFYDRRRRFYQGLVACELARAEEESNQLLVIQAIMELRQIASVPEARTQGLVASAKRARLMAALSEAVANGHKCLVFCNFVAGVECVCDDLARAGLKYEQMTGASTDRQQRVDRFQTDPAVKVFVMTLKTGGVGLNLTAADTVFIMDPWWNVAAESQAVDRVHRIGQPNHVLTYRLIARDSIEEKILKLQQKKCFLVDQVLSSDQRLYKQLSSADIQFLFDR